MAFRRLDYTCRLWLAAEGKESWRFCTCFCGRNQILLLIWILLNEHNFVADLIQSCSLLCFIVFYCMFLYMEEWRMKKNIKFVICKWHYLRFSIFGLGSIEIYMKNDLSFINRCKWAEIDFSHLLLMILKLTIVAE